MSAAIAQAIIEGKCLNVRKVNDIYLHLVAIPAPDSYSHPSTVEIAAGSRLAEKDGPFKSVVRISGFPRQYKSTDRDTGEERIVRTADVRLHAVS